MVPLRAGDVVVDKYRIERTLGSGGMGVVLAATHLQLNEPVALKFLVESNLDHAVAAERFLREARATFRLRSEHTVRVMDVGTLKTGEPFIVMELLVGLDFKQLLAERGPLPPPEAALYLIQVCASLQEAHALGIIHRDLKARNLFVTKRPDGSPCVKVLDFGISKLSADADTEVAPLTQANMGMGSPRYMAPEQWTSAATVDARADIYAAGAVFYELLTGEIPLAGLPLVEVIKRIRAGAVPSPKEKRPDLPDALCRVVMKALRPRPEERFESARHFAQAIRGAVPDAPSASLSKPPPPMTLPTAVMNREVLLAQAQIQAQLAGVAGPTPPRPEPATEKPPRMPVAPTLEEGVPAARPLPRAPGLTMEGGDEFAEDAATIVTQSPMDAVPERPNPHATLQVDEVPPELAAIRRRPPSGPMVAMAPPAAPAAPAAPAPALASLFDETIGQPAVSPVPPMAPAAMAAALPAAPPIGPGRLAATIDEPSIAAPPRRIPAWLFWTLLVVSFCFAGGIAAAILTRFLP
jgi:serine/threonine protein kinase